MGYDFTLDGRDARVLPCAGMGERFDLAGGLELEIEGRRVRAALERGARDGEWTLFVDGRREPIFLATRGEVCFIHLRGRTHRVETWNALERARQSAARAGGAEEIRAPMPGAVVSIAVVAGDAVEKGQLLLTIESMKLQTAITASHAARVAELLVAVGDHFDQGSPLVRLGPDDAPAEDGRSTRHEERQR